MTTRRQNLPSCEEEAYLIMCTAARGDIPTQVTLCDDGSASSIVMGQTSGRTMGSSIRAMWSTSDQVIGAISWQWRKRPIDSCAKRLSEAALVLRHVEARASFS